MQLTRTIASILALGLALSAIPVHAEGEDAPLPGDFQLAPAPKPPKAKPLNLPPVNAGADNPIKTKISLKGKIKIRKREMKTATTKKTLLNKEKVQWICMHLKMTS